MKKIAVLALIAFLALNQSQAKTNLINQGSGSLKRTVMMNRTVTKSVLVLAIPRAQRRLLVTDLDDSDNLPGPNELDSHVFYRRPSVNKSIHFETDQVDDYVALRLAVARAKSMQKYREKWTDLVDQK